MITKKFTRRPSKFGMPEISASEAPIGYRSCVVLPEYRPSLVRVILLLNSKVVNDEGDCTGKRLINLTRRSLLQLLYI